MILRVLIWLVLIYIIIKIVRIVSFYTASRRSKYEQGQAPIPPFSNVEEADFEDVTPKPDDSTENPTPPSSPAEK